MTNSMWGDCVRGFLTCISCFVCVFVSWSFWGCLSEHASRLCECACRFLQVFRVLAYTFINTSIARFLGGFIHSGKKSTRPEEQQLITACLSLQHFELHRHEKKVKEKFECVCILERKPPWWDKQLLSVAVCVLQGWLTNHSVRKRADRYTGWVCDCEGDETLWLAHASCHIHTSIQPLEKHTDDYTLCRARCTLPDSHLIRMCSLFIFMSLVCKHVFLFCFCMPFKRKCLDDFL